MDRHGIVTRFFTVLVTLIFWLPSSQAQSQWTASTPEVIASPSPGNRGPRIRVFDNGIPLAFWGEPDGLGGNIWVARGNGSGGWLDPVMVDVGPANPFISSVEGPEMEVWGNDRAYIVFGSGSQAWIARSDDGGMTWSSNQMSPAGTHAILVQVSVDEAGHPIGAWLADNGSEYTWEVARSMDYGETFGSSTASNESALGFNVCECCPSTILFDEDSIFVMFRNNNSNVRDSWLARSTDGGASYPDATDIDPSDWIIGGCPATGPDGALVGDSVITVWMTGAFGSPQIWVSTAHRETMIFGDAKPLAIDGRREPQLAGSEEAIAAVWHHSGPGFRKVYLAVSTTGSGGLKNSQMVLGDSTVYAGYPDVTWDPSSSEFHVVWEQEGNVMYSRVGEDLASGFEQFESALQDVLVVSSEAPGELTYLIKDPALTQLELFDASGRLIRTEDLQNSNSGRLTDLPSGMIAITAYKEARMVGAHKTLIR